MPDDVEQGAKVDAHGGATRAGEVGHGSGQLHSVLAKCPVCEGRGLVPNGFYGAVGVESYTTNSLAPEMCRSCQGRGWIQL